MAPKSVSRGKKKAKTPFSNSKTLCKQLSSSILLDTISSTHQNLKINLPKTSVGNIKIILYKILLDSTTIPRVFKIPTLRELLLLDLLKIQERPSAQKLLYLLLFFVISTQ